jgi:hypothetical protein
VTRAAARLSCISTIFALILHKAFVVLRISEPRRFALIRDAIVLDQNRQFAGEQPLKVIIEIIGWSAAVMMLSAYLLLTSGRLRSLSPAYQWLNVLSGAGFIVNSGWNGAYPSATLNLIWMAIGLYGLFRGARVQPGPAA